MPSDARAAAALEALKTSRAAFHSALATAADELRSLLARHRAPPEGVVKRAYGTLGSFADAHIDADRFAALFTAEDTLDPLALARIEVSLETLTELLEVGDALHRMKLDEGVDLPSAVAGALGNAGRAFGAGRAAEAARTGAYEPRVHDGFALAFPFFRWNATERSMAPPLVVETAGADLRVAGLAEFLDGGVKLVLVVDDPAPPARLVRLVTPGVLVAQVVDPGELPELLATPGPGIVALVPEGCAVFTHWPSADSVPRLEVRTVPEPPQRLVGGLSVFQQVEELRQLALLSSTAASTDRGAVPADGPTVEPPQPVLPADRLAAWLLKQASIPEPA